MTQGLCIFYDTNLKKSRRILPMSFPGLYDRLRYIAELEHIWDDETAVIYKLAENKYTNPAPLKNMTGYKITRDLRVVTRGHIDLLRDLKAQFDKNKMLYPEKLGR